LSIEMSPGFNLEGEGLVNRFDQPRRAVCTARQEASFAMNFLPNRNATAAAVPEPQKKSATISPGFELARITRSRSPSGFGLDSQSVRGGV